MIGAPNKSREQTSDAGGLTNDGVGWARIPSRWNTLQALRVLKHFDKE